MKQEIKDIMEKFIENIIAAIGFVLLALLIFLLSGCSTKQHIVRETLIDTIYLSKSDTVIKEIKKIVKDSTNVRSKQDKRDSTVIKVDDAGNIKMAEFYHFTNNSDTVYVYREQSDSLGILKKELSELREKYDHKSTEYELIEKPLSFFDKFRLWSWWIFAPLAIIFAFIIWLKIKSRITV